MDNLTFLATVIDSIAWPIFFLLIFLLARKNLQILLQRLISLKWGDKEASFSPHEKAQIGEKLEDTPTLKLAYENEEKPISFGQNKAFNIESADYLKKKYPALLKEKERIEHLVHHARENGENNSSIEQALIENLAQSNLRAWCEREYNTIYGSQIILLKILYKNPNGFTRDEIEDYFSNTFHSHPEFYKNTAVDDYLKFLFQSGVIKFKNDRYRITELGISFLTWISDLGLPEHKLG